MSALVLSISLAFLLLYPAVAKADVPTAYLTESVSAAYNPDGSLQSAVQRLGFVEVEVPNNQDVLQYLILNLSGTTNTNLNSVSSYKGVAASPNAGDMTRMYVNTTTGESNLSYEVGASVAPVIYLELDYSNTAGGQDIFSGGMNYMDFNLTINSTHNLNGVSLTLRFARNIVGLADSVHLYGVTADSGTPQVTDFDSDGYFDTVTWAGDLTSGIDVGVNFQGEITPGTNFNENFMFVDFDSGTASQASYSNPTSTFTGIVISDRFSRGPVREGIEMYTMTNWAVRGFLRNMAIGIDYIVHGWELYQVGSGTPLDTGVSNIDPFAPSAVAYTDWYDTGVVGASSKVGYYSVAWDWEVLWGTTTYSSQSLSTLTLPTMYEIDLYTDRSVILTQNSGTVGLSIQDQARHIGHSSLEANEVHINGVLPRTSAGAATNTWTPSNVVVMFSNASGNTDITSQVTVTTQPSSVGNGYVNVDINDLSAIIGGGLAQNEDIIVTYTVSGNTHVSSQNYSFCQTSTLVTTSGTPVSVTSCENVIIPGVGGVEPGPGPDSGGTGGGTTVVTAADFADIVREVGEGYFIAENLVRVSAKYNIVDTGDKGIKDIKSVIYIPEYGELDLSSITFRIQDHSTGVWEEWIQGIDFNVNDNGLTVIGEGSYREFALIKASSGGLIEEGLNLFDKDRIEMEYRTTVPVGSAFVITRVLGYNYYQDSYIFEDLYVPIRREGAFHDLEVNETEWQMDQVVVGRPVKWIKGLTIHNLNEVSVEQSLTFEVFGDTLSANLITQGSEAKKALELKGGEVTHVDVLSGLRPGETRTYVLEVTTPPVLETKRNVDILDSTEKEITFMVNTTLVNFAEEEYTGVTMIFRADPEKILEIKEGDSLLNYTGDGYGKTKIFLGTIGGGWERKLSITYREVPPILLSSMDAITYGCDDYANMTIFVIPSEMETGAYLEIEAVGPEPHLNTLNAQLVEIKDIYPWEELEVPVSLDMRTMPDGRYFVTTYFKKDFQTILTDQIDFNINCPERTIVSVSWVGFAVLSVAISGFLVIRAWRRKRHPDEMRNLKKKLKDLK
jgi:hypothetical protein